MMRAEGRLDVSVPPPTRVKPAVKHVAPNLSPKVISKPAEMRELCRRITEAGSFAFDTEFVMEDGYETQVCLMQVATESEVALIDALSGADAKPVWNLVSNPDVEVVVHAGAEDLALCHQITGKVPANVFDVQIANGLVSGDYPISLARLARNALRVRLHKSQTLTDWRKRPLSEEQLRYAVADVAYLPAIRQLLGQKLRKTRRTAWAREEFAKFEALETYEPPKQARVYRLKGIGSLDGQRLAVAMDLLDAREELARKYNRPARAVVRDHLLVEIARHRWTKAEQIRSLRGLQLRPQAIQELVAAVKRSLARPRSDWPTPPVSIEDTPEEIVLTSLLTAVLRDYCLSHNVAMSLMATKQTMRDVIHAHTRTMPTRSALQRGWRARATGKMISGILRGKSLVGVAGDGTATRLKLVSHAGPPGDGFPDHSGQNQA